MGVLSVILAILAVGGAVLATFLFGTAGAIAVGVLAAIAVVLGILKRKRDGKGGIAAIVISVIAIVLAIALASVWSSMFGELHKKAVEYKPDGMWAQISEKTDGGIMGIISRLPSDEAGLNALMDEMNELNAIKETGK